MVSESCASPNGTTTYRILHDSDLGRGTGVAQYTVLTRLRGSVLAFRTHVESRVRSTRWEVTVKNLITHMRTLMRDDSGQDLLEYALLVALIALVAVVAVTNSGLAVNSIFTTVANALRRRQAARKPFYDVTLLSVRRAADTPRVG